MKLAPLTLLLPVVAVAGCHGCHEDHPYVPYTIGSSQTELRDAGAAAPPVASASSAVVDAAAPFAGEPAVPAPTGLSLWPVGGVVLQAPPGMVFVSAVVRDFDGDGAADAFAVARPPEGSDPGVLVFYRGAPHGDPGDAGLAGQTTFSPAIDAAHAAGCTAVDRLVAVGRRSVLVELGDQCPPRAGNAPDRWLAVLAGGATPRVRMAATIVDPPGAPSLTVEGDAADRDGDGLEDVALRVTLEGGSAPLEPGPRVGATLAWLDRPAGLSRDAAATESSFATLAGQAAGRAKSAKDAATVPGLVAQTRALWRAVCADGGAPRLVGVSGTGAISCGSTRALEEAGLAEVRADVTLGDALRAALALDRAERPPASRTASRVTEARGWIEQVAPLVAARGVRAVSAVPQSGKGHEPAWGALAFEPSGKLLVRTRAGVVRVDADAGDEASADDVAAWPAAVTSPDGALRWIETYDACDGVALHATFAGGDDVHDVALPVAPSLGDRCAGSRGAPARALAVAWGPGGLEAIVEGQPLLVAPETSRASLLAAFQDSSPAARGAPRSPDGKVVVAVTSVGLLVRSASRARLYRAPELDGTWSEQRDCAVSNDATHVACVRAGSPGKAWVGAWDAP
ncbi:MAG: hypothetical protein ABSE49_34180 [Polyangiaceae bacterium]|jgi:hypothetical protein